MGTTTKVRRLPAYVLLAQCVLGTLALAVVLCRGEFEPPMWRVVALLGTGIVAVSAWCAGRRWGARLAMAQWALQVPVLAAPGMECFLWYGLQLHLKLQAGAFVIGVNCFALAMLAWTLHSQRRRPPRRAADVPAGAQLEG